MNVQELRIGNYLKTVEFSNEYFEVRAISKDRLLPLTLVDKDGYSVDWRLDEALPISLTEQWLIDLGFDKIGKYSYVSNHYLHFRLDTKVLNYRGVNLVELHHVHQLQNLYFSLVGTELTCAPQS